MMRTNRFGELLRSWRKRRRLSQMALADAADVSPRHISYLETGKSAPSRSMVRQLADALSVPPHARNDWLTSAGYAPVVERSALGSEELRPYLDALERLIARHDPYPAWALDASWQIVRANKAGSGLLAHLGLRIGDNPAAAIAADPDLGGAIVNWEKAVAHLAMRVSGEARRRSDDATAAIARQLAARAPRANLDRPLAPALTTRIRIGDRELELVSVQAVFNTAFDLTLTDLRIELFYPVDEKGARMLEKGLPAP
ncbi:hypothetical protein ASS64_07745 [Erythrobacter sp. AP23]|nr:hypothetical protein ASS64_07745 [Erythrobacter sp. AP23]